MPYIEVNYTSRNMASNTSNTLKYILLLLIISACKGRISSVEKTYEKGLEAYSGERWSECITKFEESLHLYKLYKSLSNNCRLKCRSHENNQNIGCKYDDLKMYDFFLNERYCLINCIQTEFEKVNLYSDVDKSILQRIKDRQPYAFLHVCYFQMYDLPKAASAAYTYLMAHPDDEVMKNNLKYYTKQPEVDANEVIDFESEDFEVLHRVGIKSYDQKKYGESIVAMEGVLTDFLAWDRSCRMECEHLPEQESSSEFVITVSNNIQTLLQCRQQCQKKLTTLGYESGVEFLADILNYLQISYYHHNQYEEAAQAVASYLALMPHDEDMLQNKNIYGSLVDEKAFTERSEIDHYSKYDKYEKELLSRIYRTNTYAISSNSIES